jgi:RNA polymerase sigma-70 factor (ECF subfamily)
MHLTAEIDSTAEDQQLMNELNHRDPHALEKLYQRYKTVLKSIVFQVLHDDADADDVLQDVFLQVWDKSGTYSAEKGRLLSWLATLARRRAIDRLRQHSAYRRAADRFGEETTASEEGTGENHTVEDAAQNDDLKHLIGRHLNLLPLLQREAIHMTFYEGKSQREISSLTGTPLGTVKTRIELGMKKLSHSIGGMKSKII